jgi:hypothetical protein
MTTSPLAEVESASWSFSNDETEVRSTQICCEYSLVFGARYAKDEADFKSVCVIGA